MSRLILSNWQTYLYLGCFLVLFLMHIRWSAWFERGRSQPTGHSGRSPRVRHTMSRRRAAGLPRGSRGRRSRAQAHPSIAV